MMRMSLAKKRKRDADFWGMNARSRVENCENYLRLDSRLVRRQCVFVYSAVDIVIGSASFGILSRWVAFDLHAAFFHSPREALMERGQVKATKAKSTNDNIKKEEFSFRS